MHFAYLGYGYKPSVYEKAEVIRIVLLWVWGTISRLLLNASYKFDKGQNKLSIGCFHVFISLFIDIFWFKTSLSIQEYLGVSIIVISNFIIVIYKCAGKL